LKGKSGEKRGPSVVLILSFDPLPSLPFFSSFCFLSWKKNLFEKSLVLHLQERNVQWRDKNWLIQITIIIIFLWGMFKSISFNFRHFLY